jgi:hypothetical protein
MHHKGMVIKVKYNFAGMKLPEFLSFCFSDGVSEYVLSSEDVALRWAFLIKNDGNVGHLFFTLSDFADMLIRSDNVLCELH